MTGALFEYSKTLPKSVKHKHICHSIEKIRRARYTRLMIGLAFSPEQFKTLLRMVYIANTVVNGHRDEDFVAEYDNLEQYVFSRAKDAGLPAATSHHRLAGEEHHHPSPSFDNDPEVNTLLDQYDVHIMLELLSEKLAEKEIEVKFGPNAKDKMPAVDFENLLIEYAEAYTHEFLLNGFKNVEVKRGEPSDGGKV
jgi:hypothetical protein